MRHWSLIPIAALCLATLACASYPTPADPAPARAVTPAPVDPVGTFDFSTTVEGSIVNGVVTITKTDTGFGGSISTNVTETIPVCGAVVDGQKLTVTAEAPEGPIAFVMEFQGDDFSGTWTMATMSGTHTGKRRKA